MTYKMFLDDERFPTSDDWVIVRSSNEAIDLVKHQGMPYEIAFDHDLGEDDTSMKFVHWIIEAFYDGNLVFPDNFTFYVHSQNPIGARNIESLMVSFLFDIGRS